MTVYIDLLTQCAQTCGLTYDRENNFIYGPFNGFTVFIQRSSNSAAYHQISLTVANNGIAISKKELKEIAKTSNKLVKANQVAGFYASFLVRLGNDAYTAAQVLRDALGYLTNELQTRGYCNVCEHCAQMKETAPYVVGGQIRLLCPECFESVSQNLNELARRDAETPENVPAGIVGALGGAIIGAVVVVLMGQLGFVSALSGLIAAVCSLKGYELLAKKLSIKGIIISCVLMLVMLYIGNRVDWAIAVSKAFNVDFFSAFRGIPELVKQEAEVRAEYIKNLVMVILFALLGAVPTILTAIKNQKVKYTSQKLN
ncbi:MAG: hypothetical protein II781_02260 [Clostridia bacterium]|nr:hypothetical protein [Clostridia bacterium]